MRRLKILENATDNMIREFKEIHSEAIKAGHAVDKISETTFDDDRLIRQIEKYADEIIPELEILKQDIEKWKRERQKRSLDKVNRSTGEQRTKKP